MYFAKLTEQNYCDSIVTLKEGVFMTVLQCIGIGVLLARTHYLVTSTNYLFTKIQNLEDKVRQINFKKNYIKNETNKTISRNNTAIFRTRRNAKAHRVVR